MPLRRPVAIAPAGLAAASVATAGIVLLFEYYRWPSVPALTCALVEGGVEIQLANQPREWANLDPTDTARNYYVLDGASEPGFEFDPPDATGSATYSPFSYAAPAFPFHFALRLETISNGAPVHQSVLAVACTGAGAPSGEIVNWFPKQTPRFYRLASAPPVECTSVAENVMLRFVSPEVAGEGLPDGATLDRVYSSGGAETFDGPFELPVGAGAAWIDPPEAKVGAVPDERLCAARAGEIDLSAHVVPRDDPPRRVPIRAGDRGA